MLPCPSSPRRSSDVSVTRRNWLAIDVRNAVVPRQPLVHKRVVGVQQIHHAAVFAARCSRRTAWSPRAWPGAGCRRNRGRSARSGDEFLRLRRNSHCSAKLSTSASARGSASMRLTCCSSTAGSCSLPSLGDVQQLVVRKAAPQEERQARSQRDDRQVDKPRRWADRSDRARSGTEIRGLPE